MGYHGSHSVQVLRRGRGVSVNPSGPPIIIQNSVYDLSVIIAIHLWNRSIGEDLTVLSTLHVLGQVNGLDSNSIGNSKSMIYSQAKVHCSP